MSLSSVSRRWKSFPHRVKRPCRANYPESWRALWPFAVTLLFLLRARAWNVMRNVGFSLCRGGGNITHFVVAVCEDWLLFVALGAWRNKQLPEWILNYEGKQTKRKGKGEAGTRPSSSGFLYSPPKGHSWPYLSRPFPENLSSNGAGLEGAGAAPARDFTNTFFFSL